MKYFHYVRIQITELGIVICEEENQYYLHDIICTIQEKHYSSIVRNS